MSYAPLGYYGLGQAESAVAGPVNGVATLRRDVQESALNAIEAYGSDIQLDRAAFRSLLRRFKDEPQAMQGTRLQPEQTRNFVIGCISETAAVVARAEQLAGLRTRGPTQRAENHRAQAELIGAGRIMLDSCNTMLRSAVPVVDGGTSGLGAAPIPIALIVAIVAVAIVVGVAIIAAIALCADSMIRMIQARGTANRICQETEGGCTPEQYAAIVERLRIGPFDQLARGGEAALRSSGAGVATTVVLAGAGILAVGGLWFLFGTQAGRRTIEGIRQAGRRKKAAA